MFPTKPDKDVYPKSHSKNDAKTSVDLLLFIHLFFKNRIQSCKTKVQKNKYDYYINTHHPHIKFSLFNYHALGTEKLQRPIFSFL